MLWCLLLSLSSCFEFLQVQSLKVLLRGAYWWHGANEFVLQPQELLRIHFWYHHYELSCLLHKHEAFAHPQKKHSHFSRWCIMFQVFTSHIVLHNIIVYRSLVHPCLVFLWHCKLRKWWSSCVHVKQWKFVLYFLTHLHHSWLAVTAFAITTGICKYQTYHNQVEGSSVTLKRTALADELWLIDNNTMELNNWLMDSYQVSLQLLRNLLPNYLTVLKRDLCNRDLIRSLVKF